MNTDEKMLFSLEMQELSSSNEYICDFRTIPAPASNVETPRTDGHGIIFGPEPAPRLAGGRHFTQSHDSLPPQAVV